jgi:signal transduction histidine kinase/DNA-binding response OmpR family regulator/CHASE3 domain sensor protein
MKGSLQLRLYGGLGISVLLVLLVGFFSINALQEQVAQTDQLVHTKQTIGIVRDLRYNLLQMRGARRAYWITNNADFLTVYKSSDNIVQPMIVELRKKIVKQPQISAEVASLDTAITSLFVYWSGEGQIQLNFSKEQIASILKKEELTLGNIYRLFDNIKVALNNELEDNQKSLENAFSQSRQIIIGGVVLLITIVLMLVNAVIATLKSRYRAAHRLKETVSKMEELNVVAQEKNRLLEGVSYVNDHIQHSENLSELSHNVIRAVVNYLEVPAGVLYLTDETKDRLEMVAGVAISASAKIGFRIGEGIIGNAALQKRAVSITDVPIDYWKVETALGNVVGRGEILCMPLWLDDDLKGVIELGIFGTFSEHQKNLLESISHNVAIAIHNQQSRNKISLLLEQVQEQKEAMVSQQEELRQTNDELSRQAEELQASEEELRTQEEELRQINSELLDKNTAVETARQALMLKAKELEITSKYKSEFLANMSHELRTPLNSVLILAKLLSDNNPKNLTTKQIEYANIIHKSGTDLLELINDILDLSKIEAGKIELNIEEVSIDTISTDLQQLFSVVAAEKKIHYETITENGVPLSLKTDRQRIEQILKNLLSNAFKFTPPDGTVSIIFSNRDQFDRKRIGISVKDSGIGIPPEKQALIFEAFQQADGSTSRKYGGTGLGLSISKELVRLLGGEMELSSEEGKGSIFTIVVPHESISEKLTLAPLPVAAAPQLEEVVEQQKVEDDRNSIEGSDRVMLIIEDDENFASIVKDFARNKGYKPIVALQGDEGLLYAKKYKPDAIILDVQLPVIDGWSLLKILKEDPETKDIPIHIISAFDDSRLQTGGALAYIKKPIDKEGLDKAFHTIGVHLNDTIKQVLIIADPTTDHFKDNSLKNIFLDKHKHVKFANVVSVEEAKEKIKGERFDCIIADIGNSVSKGVEALMTLKADIQDNEIPVIIYLNTDISSADELQLKKVSDAIVRDSPSVNNRLIDELELFLYKVQHEQKQPNSIVDIPIIDINLKGKKILVVDDDMRNVFALSTVLENEEVHVITAADGKESLEVLQYNPDTDLVLMDIMMPEMDGYEAMKRIRQDMKLVNLPVIALTAKAMTGDREKCIAAGASDYITKPVDVQKLLSLIRVWLAR